MSDIFKPRKVPKHLIIVDEYDRGKPRVSFWKLGVLLLTLSVLTLALMKSGVLQALLG